MVNPYGDLIADELERDEEDLAKFRGRALTVVTTSGAFVTLTTAAITLVAGSRKDVVTADAKWTLVVGLALFLVAGVLALIANIPSSVDRPDEDDLLERARNQWDDRDAERQVAVARAKYLRSLRRVNGKCSGLLAVAIAVEIAGFGLTATTAVLILIRL